MPADASRHCGAMHFAHFTSRRHIGAPRPELSHIHRGKTQPQPEPCRAEHHGSILGDLPILFWQTPMGGPRKPLPADRATTGTTMSAACPHTGPSTPPPVCLRSLSTE